MKVTVSLFLPESQQSVARPGALDREMRRLGRSLVLSEDDYEDDDYDDDLMDLEASNVIFTPLLRSTDLPLCLLQITSPGFSNSDATFFVCFCVCVCAVV